MIAALVALGLGAAQAAHASGHGTWQFQCMSEDDPENPLCTTELWVAHDGEDYLVYFVHDRDRKVPFIISGGEAFYESASVQVDDKEPLVTRSCDAGLCYFSPPDSTRLIRQFQRGRGARLVIHGGRSRPAVELDISLIGFTKAFARFGALD